MSVVYEWTWETTDEHGDIDDLAFYSRLSECRAEAPKGADIALLRRLIQHDDEVDRGYAYLTPTGLPDTFSDGTTVPQRFHQEAS